MKKICTLTAFVFLLFAFAPLQASDKQINSIIKAIQKNNLSNLRKSLKGVNINEGVLDSNKGTITPLLAAVFYNNVEACKILMENGASIWVEYKDGLTIFDFAMKSEVRTLRQLFIDAKNK